MFLEQIKLINFRSFEELTIDTFTQINCLVGENGAGKTNFLEGLYLLSSNRGFRTGDRKELTNRNADGFFIQGVFDGEIIERTVSEKNKKLTISKQSIPSNQLRTHNPVIAFSPNDIFLATGASETRRRFFDAAIALRDAEYSDYLAKYERALRQRNASLKKDPKNADIWNEALITNGAKIIKKRLDFVKLLIPKVETLYQQFTKGTATLKYFNNFKLSQNIEEALQNALKQSKSEDLRRKHTSKGPHRDDITLLINNLPAAKSGSQGQNRTLSFALKIGAVEIIEETLGRKPILLIDDALLEVDPKRRQYIFDKFYHSGLQLFFTGTTKEFFSFINVSEPINFIDFDH
ncbi:MAG: DNA replication/repair protein RecF [Spirochaetota bacterium]|nr:DNA replication/repair protein RecF [Spirochaetota bacterium]